MIYIGIDPSYSRTGVVYFDDEEKKITFKVIEPEGTNETYLASVNRAAYIASSIVRDLSNVEDSIIIFEEPLLNSIKASRLGLLSGILALSMVLIPSVKRIYTIPPSVISSMNRSLPYRLEMDKKKLSLFSVNLMLNYLVEQGFKIDILNNKYKKDGTMKERRLSHDEAEAFLLLLNLIKELGVLNNEIWIDLMGIHKGLTKKYKINLLKGEIQNEEE